MEYENGGAMEPNPTPVVPGPQAPAHGKDIIEYYNYITWNGVRIELHGYII